MEIEDLSKEVWSRNPSAVHGWLRRGTALPFSAKSRRQKTDASACCCRSFSRLSLSEWFLSAVVFPTEETFERTYMSTRIHLIDLFEDNHGSLYIKATQAGRVLEFRSKPSFGSSALVSTAATEREGKRQRYITSSPLV